METLERGKYLCYDKIVWMLTPTSPLYVFSSTFTEAPGYDELVQVLSVVIWSITIMVTLKYVLIVLRADNEGEGGTFSCYSLLTRYVGPTNYL